jgi:hypothetical protein
MTAKEKAKELVDRFKGVTRPFSKRHTLKVNMHPEHAKQCALICVDEILNSHIDSVYEAYYLEVKQEINYRYGL